MNRSIAALFAGLLVSTFASAQAAPDAGSPADAGFASAPAASHGEDDMFGGDSPVVTTVASAPDAGPVTLHITKQPTPADSHTDAEINSLAPIDENKLLQSAEAMNNKLTIGGLFYSRFEFDQHAKTAAAISPITMPNLLDIYLDARPSDDLRVYVRGRLIYNPAAGSEAGQLTAFGSLGQSSCTSELCPFLDQMWIKWNAWHKVFLTLGRQHVKWGAGMNWNPTDFLNSVKLNPVDIIDQRLGVDMLKIHIPIESLAWNLYGVVLLDQQNGAGVTSLSQIGYAARGEFVLGPAEVALSALYQDHAPLKLGADISMGIWDIDWHAEAALLHPIGLNQIVTYSGAFNIDAIPPVLPPGTDRDHQWFPQVVLGADYSLKYSDQDALTLSVEFFYNSLGYTTPSLYPVLIETGNFIPLYNGKLYGAASIVAPNPGNWNSTTFSLAWIGNISDNSDLLRLDWRQTVLTWLQTDVYAGWFFGSWGELHYGIPADPELAAHLALAQTLGIPISQQNQQLAGILVAGVQPETWQVGVGFIVNL